MYIYMYMKQPARNEQGLAAAEEDRQWEASEVWEHQWKLYSMLGTAGDPDLADQISSGSQQIELGDLYVRTRKNTATFGSICMHICMY